jgi:E1A/CREB-binding protein
MPESKDDKAESSNKKRDAEGNVRDAEQSEETKSEEGYSKVKVIDDDAEDMDCEFFNNRQAFLNLCRGNHYQFDEIRRAKHTSMMVLWHLHNRDAPKFVQQCASCLKEILSGVRFHCDICPEYDICQNCYRSSQCNRGACAHRLRPVAVDNAQDTKGEGRLTEAQRRERQRNLELHIQLIEHAARCNSSSCTSSNCAKMKSYLQHGQVCKVRASGGCKICKRIWTLLRIHAQKCKDRYCPVPQCIAIRDRLRQMAKQQQAMDDRRRQEMNRHYRMNMMAHNHR